MKSCRPKEHIHYWQIKGKLGSIKWEESDACNCKEYQANEMKNEYDDSQLTITIKMRVIKNVYS